MVLRHPLTERMALYGMNGGTCRILPKGVPLTFRFTQKQGCFTSHIQHCGVYTLDSQVLPTDEEMDQYELDAVEHPSVQEAVRSCCLQALVSSAAMSFPFEEQWRTLLPFVTSSDFTIKWERQLISLQEHAYSL